MSEESLQVGKNLLKFPERVSRTRCSLDHRLASSGKPVPTYYAFYYSATSCVDTGLCLLRCYWWNPTNQRAAFWREPRAISPPPYPPPFHPPPTRLPHFSLFHLPRVANAICRPRSELRTRNGNTKLEWKTLFSSFEFVERSLMMSNALIKVIKNLI